MDESRSRSRRRISSVALFARWAGQAALGKHLGGKGHRLLHGDKAGIRQHVHDRLDDLLAARTDIERGMHVDFEGNGIGCLSR